MLPFQRKKAVCVVFAILYKVFKEKFNVQLAFEQSLKSEEAQG